MKCKCGNIIPFWDVEFKVYKCYDCQFTEDLKEKVSAIKMEIKKDPKIKLSKLAKGYISVAIDKGILKRRDAILARRFS